MTSRFLTIATLATLGLATLGPAGAANAAGSGVVVKQLELDNYVQGVDVSSLSKAQLLAVRQTIDSEESAADAVGFIYSIVNNN